MTSGGFIFKIILPLVLIGGSFLFPIFELDIDIATILTVVSLIFAILIGFFIATATTNYINLRNLIAEDDGILITIYNLGKIVSPSREKDLADAIDEYVMSALDFEIHEYQDKTQEKYNKIIAIIDSLEPEDDKKRSVAALTYLHETKSNSFKTRQLISIAADRVISNLHWFIMGLITLLVVTLLFALRSDHWFSQAIVAIISLSTYLILVLLHQIDSNVFDEEQFSFKNPQKIFEALGRAHYYPNHAIKSGRVKNLPATYRTGIFDRPSLGQREIKHIKNKDAS